MTTMRDCNNPEHAIAYDHMRAIEQSWLQRWREDTGRLDAIPEYGELLQWISDQHDEVTDRLMEVEQVTASTEPAKAVHRLKAVMAKPEPKGLTFAKAVARRKERPPTC